MKKTCILHGVARFFLNRGEIWSLKFFQILHILCGTYLYIPWKQKKHTHVQGIWIQTTGIYSSVLHLQLGGNLLRSSLSTVTSTGSGGISSM